MHTVRKVAASRSRSGSVVRVRANAPSLPTRRMPSGEVTSMPRMTIVDPSAVAVSRYSYGSDPEQFGELRLPPGADHLDLWNPAKPAFGQVVGAVKRFL